MNKNLEQNIMFYRLAARNLLRNKRRSLATLLSMSFGFVGIVLLFGYIIRSERFLMGSTVYIAHNGHVNIYKKDAVDLFWSRPKRFVIKKEEIEKIEQILSQKNNMIEKTGHSLEALGLVSNGQKSVPFIATGIEPEIENWIYSHPYVNKWAFDLIKNKSTSDRAFGQESISMTSSLTELLGLTDLKKGESLQLAAMSLEGDLNAVNATWTSTHTTGLLLAENTSLIAPLKLIQDLLRFDGVKSIQVYLNNRWDTSSMAKFLNAEFRKNDLEFSAYPYYDEKIGSIYLGNLNFLFVMAMFFLFLILGAVVLAIYNTMSLGLMERIKEFGTIRAIGFRLNDVKSMLHKEGHLLLIISSIFGIVLSIFIAGFINSLNIRFEPPALAGDMQFFLAVEWWLCLVTIIPFLCVSTFTIEWICRKKLTVKITNLLN